jgi:hypothetical protein
MWVHVILDRTLCKQVSATPVFSALRKSAGLGDDRPLIALGAKIALSLRSLFDMHHQRTLS